MDSFSDFLLGLGSFSAAFYCFVLGRKVRRYEKIDSDIRSAITCMSDQVSILSRALDRTRASAKMSTDEMLALTEKAERFTKRLELLIAALHDLPEENSSIVCDPRFIDDVTKTPKFLRASSGRE